jgi:CheY-like chemotaxis protein
MTIALVEDDEAVLDSLSLLLKARGMDTQAFTSADAFSPPGDDYSPACILSDVRLPACQTWNSRLPWRSASPSRRRCSRVPTNCEGDDDVMRNGRATDRDNPFGSLGHRVRVGDWDPIRGSHQGQRSCAATTGRTLDLHPTASSYVGFLLQRGRRPHMT